MSEEKPHYTTDDAAVLFDPRPLTKKEKAVAQAIAEAVSSAIMRRQEELGRPLTGDEELRILQAIRFR